jgi:exopolysaccharide biosynthesis WecB/TagA/CpsF family protein
MSSVEFDSESGLRPASDLRVNIANMTQAIGAIDRRARAKKGYTLFTINLDHLVKLKQDRRFREVYERADFVTADGWPIVWHLQRGDRRRVARPGQQDRRRLERTTGADLIAPVCAHAAEHGFPLYFVGPSPASQNAALDILRARYPGLSVGGAESPHLPVLFGEDTVDALAERIAKSGARLCVLSLGAPKQEMLADALHKRLPDVGFLCVGAALDFISGQAVRAPVWLRRLKMEWMWRLASDPGRLAGRYARCAGAFLNLVSGQASRRSLNLRLVDSEFVDELHG